MQRIICRYRQDDAAGAVRSAELHAIIRDAAGRAGLVLSDERRPITFGPPLPPGATSESERMVLDLGEPRDPAEVRELLNAQLPPTLSIAQAWIAPPGSPDEHPALLDEAVYLVAWDDAPPPAELLARLRTFLQSTEVPFTRVRETKTQRLNARALVRDVHLLSGRPGPFRLLVTLAVGSQGSLRPDELLTVLGYTPMPGRVQAHRVALHASAWREPAPSGRPARWPRPE